MDKEDIKTGLEKNIDIPLISLERVLQNL